MATLLILNETTDIAGLPVYRYVVSKFTGICLFITKHPVAIVSRVLRDSFPTYHRWYYDSKYAATGYMELFVGFGI